ITESHDQEPCRGELSAITAEPSWRAPCPSTSPGLSCGILQQKCTWRGDPMAEASVLAAPGAHVADKSNKAVLAAAIGNLLEWYDFGVYAYLAGLIATKFFPNSDPTASLLAAVAACSAVSSRSRPPAARCSARPLPPS